MKKMKEIKRMLVPLLAAGLLSTGALVTVVTNANAVACSVSAPLPTKSGQTITGHGKRSNCSNQVILTTKLVVKSSPWDQDLAFFHFVFKNGSGTAAWSRPNSSSALGWNFFSVAETNDGAYAKSSLYKPWN